MLRPLLGRSRFEISLVEVEPGEAVARNGYAIRCFEVEHRVRACGYSLAEEDRPGRFDAEAAVALGVPEGPAFGALQSGESVEGGSGTVTPAKVMGEARRGERW